MSAGGESHVASSIKTRLKGGSLSGTYLIETQGKKFVRKEVDLNHEREYGFMRWYSQLKKLQRLGELFPGIFPKIIDYGREGTHAYFDMEYIEDAVSGFSFLESNPSEQEVDIFLQAMIKTLDTLHSVKRTSSVNAIELYLYEEMERPLTVCAKDAAFAEFLKHKTIIFNGNEVPSLMHNLPIIYRLAKENYKDAWECYTHGNVTLENTLWVPKEKKLWFIDVYEENVADTIYNEYSQLLQSCNSYYELYNARDAHVDGNVVTITIEPYPALDYFNKQFNAFMHKKLSKEEIILVKIYEISQFTRMLPFKLHVAKDKMIFFYSLASYLLHQLLQELNYHKETTHKMKNKIKSDGVFEVKDGK